MGECGYSSIAAKSSRDNQHKIDNYYDIVEL